MYILRLVVRSVLGWSAGDNLVGESISVGPWGSTYFNGDLGFGVWRGVGEGGGGEGREGGGGGRLCEREPVESESVSWKEVLLSLEE